MDSTRKSGPRQPSVLVLGNNCVDHVYEMEGPPAVGGKTQATAYRRAVGGQAANVAMSLAGLGVATSFVGAFGDDENGELCSRALAGAGVDLSLSRTASGSPHSTATVLVDRAGADRTILMFKDPRLRLGEDAVPDASIGGYSLIYTDNHEPACSLSLTRRARAAGVPVVADLETLEPDAVQAAMLATVLIAPGDILRAVAGSPSLHEALARILAGGPAVAVATLGAGGALAAGPGGEPFHVPAKPCRVLDSTGAGDAFHAGYVVGMLRGLGFEESLGLAARLAALKCGHQGPCLPAEALADFSSSVLEPLCGGGPACAEVPRNVPPKKG